MEWIIVAVLYFAALLVATYRFGSFGALGMIVFASVQAVGIHYEWSSNPLVAVSIAGFATFMTTIMIPHWCLVATGREGIISRNRTPDEDF